MKRGDYQYIWQQPDWPNFRYDLGQVAGLLGKVSRAQGVLDGRLKDVGFALQSQTSLSALTGEVVKTSEIEGEHLSVESVRSSIARRLGVDIGGLLPPDRNVDGVVDMVLDAANNAWQPLTAKRLQGWHAGLFPTGFSGLSRIRVGVWRNDATGPMQVVSGPNERRKVHFEAPAADALKTEMTQFLLWANRKSDVQTAEPALLNAALAHLWFVTIHPFDDGNGRIARAVGDLFLARADAQQFRAYSMSSQIQKQRKQYYEMLEKTQKGDLDVTDWVVWFLATLLAATQDAEQAIDVVMTKAKFWQRWAAQNDLVFNPRQINLINRLLDGFEGKLTSRKWAAIAKCSPDTALRDISELVSAGVLEKSEAGGRSTSYQLSIQISA